MKKSTTRLLIGALIVGLLAYFFLYKRREGFQNICKSECSGRKGVELKVCHATCQYRNARPLYRQMKCGRIEADPNCAELEKKIANWLKIEKNGLEQLKRGK